MSGRGLSVVIPSGNLSNLIPCIAAVLSREKDRGDLRIIVVDDCLNPYYFPGPVTVVSGQSPFSFPRNINIGLMHTGDDDVILMNDDALLETENGFSIMQGFVSASPDYGLIAASTNNVGNENQFRKHPFQLRDEPRMVCFVCVLIPRRTLDLVGNLDERYTGYGLDDDDYCLRVHNAGLKLGILDDCFVNHSVLPSSFRTGQTADYRPNLRRFIEKWGVDNWGRNKEESGFKELFP